MPSADDKPEANQLILRLLLHVGLLPGAEIAARAKRARARLARLKVRARLPRCPARSRRSRSRGVMRLTPPRTRTARPKRMHRGPHTRGALGAALALHARRAPVGRWELKAGGRAEGLWASVSASRV